MQTDRLQSRSRRKWWLDIWRTMAFCNHPLVNREPVIRAQQLVGLRCNMESSRQLAVGFPPIPAILDDDFLHWSLTNDIATPTEFVTCAERQFGCVRVANCEEHFADLVDAEKEGTELYPDVIPSLGCMADNGVDIGIFSNLWRFPAERIMDDLGLGRFFAEPESIIFSYQVGLRKPDPRIFAEAIRRSGKKPDENVIVDDNLDVITGASRAGMRAVLMDREGKYSPATVAHLPNCAYVTNMAQVLELMAAE